ncbi:multiple epidermal growth factor-like domains protein 11 isoform X2 [Ostrea edulis]|uniref:multiple epidermal growth factor-like domains protein 11 isoform X2 n=1 Tax=Ostrea edulis TaxID=37623 RepID=UPI0024AF7DA8|nr:multiple epidermal growth factor-like domains protein 11 isoform X2 [Ostrea edulis]
MRTLPHVFYSLLTMLHFCTGYDKLSLGKPTIQSNLHPCRGCEASHAVDGDHSTCVNTEDGFPVTWHIDLQEVKSIARISIFYNTSGIQGQVHNYEVYLSNTAQWQNSFLCVKDALSYVLPGLVGNCQVFARYVIFHNAVASDDANSAVLKFSPVCEVIVEGCEQSGTYGLYCDKRCPENCRDNICRIEGGDCYSCRDGWTGNKCEKPCTSGWFGRNCSKHCSENCIGGNCDHVDAIGTCIDGCKPGWMNRTCNQACSSGWYGRNCSKSCSENCIGGNCDHVDGTCINGCQPGWMNKTCKQVCFQGAYGENCSQKCGGNCARNRTCNPVDGSCGDCAEGYDGVKCDKQCGHWRTPALVRLPSLLGYLYLCLSLLSSLLRSFVSDAKRTLKAQTVRLKLVHRQGREMTHTNTRPYILIGTTYNDYLHFFIVGYLWLTPIVRIRRCIFVDGHNLERILAGIINETTYIKALKGWIHS